MGKWLGISIGLVVVAIALCVWLKFFNNYDHAYEIICHDAQQLKAFRQLHQHQRDSQKIAEHIWCHRIRCFMFEDAWHRWQRRDDQTKMHVALKLWRDELKQLNKLLVQLPESTADKEWCIEAKTAFLLGTIGLATATGDTNRVITCLYDPYLHSFDLPARDFQRILQRLSIFFNTFYKEEIIDANNPAVLIKHWSDLEYMYVQTKSLPSGAIAIGNLIPCYGRLCNFAKQSVEASGHLEIFDVQKMEHINHRCAGIFRDLKERFGNASIR